MDNLRVYLSTWNVATGSPNQDLDGLLDFPSLQNRNRPLADFYILGFQEVKCQPQNVVMDAIFSDPWTSTVTKILKKCNYVRAKSIKLQGLLLLVFCLRKHLIHLRDVETQYTRTGLGGMWGNKGAVSVRLSIYGCSVCIVNSHLSPHDNQLTERITDYNNIIKNNTFVTKDTSNILYHDYVFWLGDLNFRLSEKASDSPQDVLEMIRNVEKDDYGCLLEHDQLRNVMASGDAFSQLTESPPRFPPTYKFEIGSNEYDAKKRRPAWTDRILYKVIPNSYENVTLKAEQLNYHSLPQFTVSDHKPVVSEFIIKIRTKEIVVTRYGTSLSSSDGGMTCDNIPEETIVFSNYTERCVEFAPINKIWYIGEADFIAKYTLSNDIEVYPNDWIAVYEHDFDNLDDYITYEYVGKVASTVPSGSSNTRSIVFSFPVGSGVRSPGLYRFLYFSQPTTEVRSLLGISEPFEACIREEDHSAERQPTLQQVQTTSSESQPSSSSSSSATGIESMFKDFGHLHIPGLKFDMFNDLSID